MRNIKIVPLFSNTLQTIESNIFEFIILVAPVFFPCKNFITHADASVFPPNKTCCAPSWRKLNETTRVKLIISSSYNYSTGETHRVRDRQGSCNGVERKRGLSLVVEFYLKEWKYFTLTCHALDGIVCTNLHFNRRDVFKICVFNMKRQ